MRVRGTQTTHAQVDIEVSPRELWHTLKLAILRKHGLSSAEYLREENGKQVFKADDDHHHGSITESVVIADPTETQIAVWTTIKRLEALAEFQTLEKQQWPA